MVRSIGALVDRSDLPLLNPGRAKLVQITVRMHWSTRLQPFVGGIAKQGFKRRYKKIHAEHADGVRLNDLSGYVIGCAFTVLNTLGTGLLQKVYESLVAIEVRAAGIAVAQQRSARVHGNDAAGSV